MAESKVDVLVVEDEPTLLRIVCDALRAAGFTCAGAADGREGLRLCCDLVPKVVVTDIMMPVMDGFTLAERIRTLDADVQILGTGAGSGRTRQ